MTYKTALTWMLLLCPATAFAQLQQRLGPADHRVVHEAFVEPITAAKIRTAIDDAVMFLRGQQQTDGSISSGGYTDGATALAALAMLAAGAHPATDDN